MLKYKWKLSDSQPEQEIPLLRLQQALAASSVFLDLAFQDGGIILTIAMDDTVPAPQKHPDIAAVTDESSMISHDDIRRGRPYVTPNEDLTLGQVRHMRFMNVPMQTIADSLGVSKRTLYRRLQEINGKHLDENTPFSKWLDAE